MKGKLWVMFLGLIILILLAGCSSAPILEEQPGFSPEEVDVSSPDAPESDLGPPARLSYQAASIQDSRWHEFTITITDQNGNPVPDLPIEVMQTDLDFIYSASGSAFLAWMEETDQGWQETADAQEQIAIYNAMGFNNVEYYPWWMWTGVEPTDNQWQFEAGIDDGQFTAPDYFYGNHPQVRFHTYWMGPQFHQPGMVPGWIDYRDDDAFRTQFTEFNTAAFELNPERHFTLYEIGVEINDWSAWDGKGAWEITDEEWDWAIDFLKYEADLIRSLDPEAVISIDFDIITYFEDCEPCVLENWIEKAIAAGVDFDVLGFEFHPGSFAGEPATVDELKAFLEPLDRFGKDYYFWEIGIRSWGELRADLHLGEQKYPPVEEYTEEYQNDLYLEFLEYFMENPRIIGARYLVYIDRPDQEELIVQNSGLLRSDRTPKPAYTTLVEFWNSQLTSTSGKTDQDGQITFQAIPGLFTISSQGQTYTVHLHPPDSIFAQGQGDEIQLSGITSQTDPTPTDQPTDASSGADSTTDELLICDLNDDLIGQEVSLMGELVFVDQGGDGVFFEVEDQGCRVTGFIPAADWGSWPEDNRSGFQSGNRVRLFARLGQFMGNLELEVWEASLSQD